MKTAYAVKEKDFPEWTVLSLKTKDSLRAMGKHIGGLYGQAKLRGLRPDGPLFTVYFEKPEGEAPVEYELCLPVEGPTAELDKLTDIGGDPCLCLRVRGSYAQFGAAYKAMGDFVTAGGYRLSGPPREVYVRGPLFGFMTFLPTMVTDIYFPILDRKA